MKATKLFSIAILIGGLCLFSCKGGNEGGEGGEKSDTTNVKPSENVDGSAETDSLPKTKIEFENLEHDFGTIKEGDTVSYEFAFKNTGTSPLKLKSVKASCGCTTPDWPQEPIAPGAASKIKVKFDSKGKPGPNTKTVTVIANTEPEVSKLKISANVEKK